MAAAGASLLFNAYLNHERYTDNVSEVGSLQELMIGICSSLPSWTNSSQGSQHHCAAT
jgi:hypothetical protein